MDTKVRCAVTGQELSTEKIYSEKDVSDYLRSFLSRVLSGDSLSDPWGNEENKRLYIALFAIPDTVSGIKKKVANALDPKAG